MATQIGELKYSVGFDVKKQDLNTLKKQLQQLSKLSISDLMKINGTDRESATQALRDIKNEAQHVKDAISEAFNPKLNTVNIEAFRKIENICKEEKYKGDKVAQNILKLLKN